MVKQTILGLESRPALDMVLFRMLKQTDAQSVRVKRALEATHKA